MFGEGNTLGPDLTGADRKNTEAMLLNIVNPSAYIRPEFVSYDALTKDDQTLSGLMAESSPASVTILDRNNQRHVLARDQIEYPDEDPWTREYFQSELTTRGLKSLMPAECYENPDFEWEYGDDD